MGRGELSRFVMSRPGFTRRCLAAFAVLAVIGLGTVGLYHLYVDALDGDAAAHECVTCRAVGSAVALLTTAIVVRALRLFFVETPPIRLGIEHAGFKTRLRSRAPPIGI